MSQIKFPITHFNKVYWAFDLFKQWLTFIQLVKYAPSKWDDAVVSEAEMFQKKLESELMQLVGHASIFHETFNEVNPHIVREFELFEKKILAISEEGLQKECAESPLRKG